MDGRPLRVVHCPVNTAGVPWANVQALRRRGVDASLVVFQRYRMHPEADWSLDRHGGMVRRQLTQWHALARLLPRADLFHFYFGLTLVPQSLQFPLLRLFGKRSVMHYLGSDIRGKAPEEIAFGKKAGAEIVGSYDAIRWVPEAHVIPPGIDLSRITPVPPSDRARPVVLHAPSSRQRKGTDHVITACEGLDVELRIVEDLHHEEAFALYGDADIVVDQLKAGWYGLFAIEAMALGKPVVTFLNDEAVARTRQAFGVDVPLLNATDATLRSRLEELIAMGPDGRRRIGEASRAYVARVHDSELVTDRMLDLYASVVETAAEQAERPAASVRAPAEDAGADDAAAPVLTPSAEPALTGALGAQLRRLGGQSVIYGLGGLVSRVLAVILLPLYTHYLTPADYGRVETLVALTTVLIILLRGGIQTAFFRFWFDADDEESHRRVLRTSFWFTMGASTAGLVAGVVLAAPIAHALFGDPDQANLVRASFVALWAAMNYEQLTWVFRVEQRPVAYVCASLANIVVTVAGTLLLVVVLEKGPIGVIVGNFSGTLLVYLALLAYRRDQLGLGFDRGLLREMNRFGLPLVPSALFLWATNFSDRFFLVKLSDAEEVGLYSVGVRVASAMVLLLTAFRTAWPAFAYSIRDEREARRTYAFVLTYLVLASSWLAVALALLSPWLVDWLAADAFAEASRVVGLLAFGAVAFAVYIVVSIGVGRIKRTQYMWVVTLAGAGVNLTLNLALIPTYGMMGAAVATLAAYVVMAAGISWWSQRIYPVPYQWRRVLTAGLVGVLLVVVGKMLDGGLPVAVAITVAYPLVLAPLGFYLPSERRAIGARLRPAR
jgi:O-antigen/teichoic acid export membrane protein/glycosyltransferase involved in cell wall biosynthesis